MNSSNKRLRSIYVPKASERDQNTPSEDKKSESSVGSISSLDDTPSRALVPFSAEIKLSGLPSMMSIIRDQSLSTQQKLERLSGRIQAKTGSIYEVEKPRRQSLLHEACKDRDIELAKGLLQIEPSLLFAMANNGTNVLCYAIKFANKPLVHYFLKLKPQLATELNIKKESALHFAAKSGDIEIFAWLWNIQKKSLTEEFLTTTESLLCIAVENNHLELVKWLASHAFELMYSCENIVDAIDIAHSAKNHLLVNTLQAFLASKAWAVYLLKQNKHLVPCSTGLYPLHYFARFGCIENVKLLLDAKVSVNLPSDDEYTINANCFKTVDELKNSNVASVDDLPYDYANYCLLKMSEHVTPLALALEAGDVAMVSLLSKCGAPLDKPLAQGNYPIHIATAAGQTQMVAWLLSHKVPADIPTNDRLQLTAMHIAAGKGFLDIMQLLHKNRVELNKLDADGCRPIHYAARWNHVRELTWLIKNGVSPDQPEHSSIGKFPLLIALESGNLESVAALTESQARFTVPGKIIPTKEFDDSKNEEGNVIQRLLVASARYQETFTILQNLLAGGISIDTLIAVHGEGRNAIAPARYINMVTPLFEAIRHSNVSAVTYLIQNGAKCMNNKCGSLALATMNPPIFELLLALEKASIQKITNYIKSHQYQLDDDLLFSKPFPETIFTAMVENLEQEKVIEFSAHYLCKTWHYNNGESVIISFVNLIAERSNCFIEIIKEFLNPDGLISDVENPISLCDAVLPDLVERVINNENLFSLLVQDEEVLEELVQHLRVKDYAEKIFTHPLFSKDPTFLFNLLANANPLCFKAILATLPIAERQKLLLMDDCSLIKKQITESEAELFVYLVKKLDDQKLQRKLLNDNMGILIEKCPHFNYNKSTKYLKFLFNQLSIEEKDKVISSAFENCYVAIACQLLFYVSEDKRKELIPLLAKQIDNDSSWKWLQPEYSAKINNINGQVEICLAALDNKEERRLFFSLMDYPNASTADIFKHFQATFLTRAAAFNKICRMMNRKEDTYLIISIHTQVRDIINLMHTAKRKNPFSFLFSSEPTSRNLPEDIRINIATFLTGFDAKFTKIIMQSISDGNLSVETQIKSARTSQAAPASAPIASLASTASSMPSDAKAVTQSDPYAQFHHRYLRSTLFFQRICVRINSLEIKKDPIERLKI